jgi:hypothetical protein
VGANQILGGGVGGGSGSRAVYDNQAAPPCGPVWWRNRACLASDSAVGAASTWPHVRGPSTLPMPGLVREILVEIDRHRRLLIGATSLVPPAVSRDVPAGQVRVITIDVWRTGGGDRGNASVDWGSRQDSAPAWVWCWMRRRGDACGSECAHAGTSEGGQDRNSGGDERWARGDPHVKITDLDPACVKGHRSRDSLPSQPVREQLEVSIEDP